MTRKLLVVELILIAAAVGVTAWLYPHLPERVPTHWGFGGRVNGYSSRGTLFLLGPGLMASITVLTALIPWLSPRRFEVDDFRASYRRIMLIVFFLMAYVYAVLLWAATGHALSAERAILGGVCVFLAFLGNLMGKVRRNFYIGIRTPWTLASERVWNATHRLAGKTMVACGLLGLVLVPLGLQAGLIFVLLAGVLVPAGYSLLYYKQLERRGEIDGDLAQEEGKR